MLKVPFYKSLESEMISANGQDFGICVRNPALTQEEPYLSLSDYTGPYEFVENASTFLAIRHLFFNGIKEVIAGYQRYYASRITAEAKQYSIFSTSLNSVDSRNPGIYSIEVYPGGARVLSPAMGGVTITETWDGVHEASLDVIVDKMLYLLSFENIGNAVVAIQAFFQNYSQLTNNPVQAIVAHPSTYEFMIEHDELEQNQFFY